MRLTHLRSFYAVGRYGSVTATAEALHVSQPTVTTQVRALEESYGVELLHAIEIVAAFHQRYPGLNVSVRLGNSEDTVRDLLAYQTDVAVLAQYDADPKLYYVPWRRHPLVIIVPASHRLARRKSIRIEDLRDEQMIMREPGSTTRKALEAAMRAHRILPRYSLEIGRREAVREAVILGLGIAAVSEREHIGDPRLRKLAIQDEDVYTHAHVVCLEERRGARLVEAFLDVVRQMFASEQAEPAQHRRERRA